MAMLLLLDGLEFSAAVHVRVAARTRFTLPRQSIHTTTGWYGSELVPDLLTCRSQARIFCPQAALISMLVLGTRLDVGNTYVRRIHEEYGDGVVACYGTIRPCRR